MSLQKINVNSTDLGVVHTGDIVADPQRKWEQGTAEEYIDSEVAKERERAQTREGQIFDLIHTPEQHYVTVATYADLANIASPSDDTIYRVSNYDGDQSQVNNAVYSEYAYDGTNFVLLCVKSQIDEVYDISAHHSGNTYVDLAAALDGGNNIPQELQRGGMSVKFVQTSGNKYVQYRLKSDTWDINIGSWEIQTIEKLSCINYLPKPYVTPNKYSGFITNIGDTVTGGIDNILGERIEYVKWHFLANTFNGYSESDQPLPAGNYFFNCLIKSSVANTLNFIVFDSSSHYSRKDGIELEAGKWEFISVPFTSDANSTKIDIRFDIISADCDFYYARPSITDIETQLGQVRNFYLENNNNELLTIDKGLNLFKGCDILGYYLNNYGEQTELSSYNISRPIKVKQGQQYTINHCHIVIGYDINGNASWSFKDDSTIFNATTFTIPYGVNYIRTNVRVDFMDDFVVNQGATATNSSNYELDGSLLKPKSVHAAQLGDDVVIGVPDGSVTYAKLASTLVQYLANGANLQDSTITQAKLSATLLQYLLDGGNIAAGTITQNKLASSLLNYLLDGSHISNGTITLAQLATEVAAYFTNGGNINNGTITQAKLSTELIQFIQSAGGGTITNNADGVSIVVNALSQLSVNWEAAGIFFTKNGEDTQGVISRISAYSGKATLVLLNDLTIHNSYTTLPSNLYKVIGAGGKIIPYGERTNYVYLNFPNGCIFEGGYYQMFNKWVILNCSNGWLEGRALCDWWGCEKDGVTDCGLAMSAFMGSKFKEVRFTKGTYVAYPSNAYSNRNIYIDEDVIFDGVFHISYGNYTQRTFCRNVHVFGKVVSTLRVGGAYIDGLYIPDGIKILANNPNYINQTAEGGCKGVHFNYSNKNFEIGDIEVEQSVPQYHDGNLIATYAFGLDAGDGDNREPNHDIHIKSLKCGPNTSEYYDLMLYDGCYNITVDKLISVGGTTQQHAIVVNSTLSHDIKIGKADITFNNANAFAPVLIAGKNVMVDKIKIESSEGNGRFGLSLDGVEGAFVNNVETKNQAQGIRLMNTKNVLIVNHHSINDTTPLAQSGSQYVVLNTFVD